MVTLNFGRWDFHSNNTAGVKGHAPIFDRGLSALIEDLHERGMDKDVAVVAWGEFGRTPVINKNGGRDHWPRVFSLAMAGGGVPGGQVIGSSNPLGEFPQDNPVTPSDIVATIYTLLGIDPKHELHTSDGRPVRLAPDNAEIITSLIG